ncbi:MAG TPA: acyl-CoA reductase [Candidatus Binatia bacterium]|jgi:acyl-CoA reductase-like NAD-dependent aldehyde dehydrogenase|nr:acyl-CoA reductase [Candidatus Binatia bacterium]
MTPLGAAIDAALAARERLRDRPRRETARSLAAAATRWRDDVDLRAALPAATRLSPDMIDAVMPRITGALDADAMTELVARELGPRPTAGPALVAHVLASNVPALALPAIALGCLAGAAVVVKSGRDDVLSAPAFHRALETVDPELAATVVSTYWTGGDRGVEDAVLARADVVVASGSDATMQALAPRLGTRLLAHGARVSCIVVASDDADVAARVASDVALYDQRGCLSPHTVYVVGDASAFAERLAVALATQPAAGPATLEERAARRTLLAVSEWQGDVLHGDGVLCGPPAPFRPTCGGRVVRVQEVRSIADVPTLLPSHGIECVGIAGLDPDTAALARLGVARVCPVGRMQSPPLAWPCGQHAPLRSLLRLETPPALLVEAA